MMLSKFKVISSDILYVLFRTYCIPLYLAMHNGTCQMQIWVSCMLPEVKQSRRVWKISPQTHCVLLLLICKDLPVEVQMCKLFLKFIISLPDSCNCIVKLSFQRVKRQREWPTVARSRQQHKFSVGPIYMHDKTNVGHSKFNVPAHRTPTCTE